MAWQIQHPEAWEAPDQRLGELRLAVLAGCCESSKYESPAGTLCQVPIAVHLSAPCPRDGMKIAVLAPQRTLLRGTLSISHLAIARKARGAPTRRPRSPVAYVVALLTKPSLSSLPYPVVAAIRAPIDGKSDGGDRAPSQQCGGGVQGPCQLPACAAAASPNCRHPQEWSGGANRRPF